MDILNATLASLLAGLAGWLFLKTRQLEKALALNRTLLSDLSFRQSEASEFMQYQIDKTLYLTLDRTGQLRFKPESEIDEILPLPGVRDVLVKRKLIQKKDGGPFKESLERRAKKLGVAVEPALVDLNALEVSQ